MTNSEVLLPGLPGAHVELVHWPRDESVRNSLARAGVARLLLVEADAEPPEVTSVNEDWIRLPVDDRELRHRAQRLSRWVAHLADERLVLGPNRIVHRGGAAVALGELEATLLQLLLNQTEVVPRDRLEASLWPNGAPSRRSLDNVVFRLRGHLEHLGVAIRSARSRGLMLEVDDVASGLH